MNISPYQKTQLDNGITVISEHIPHVRSVSIGVWLRTGTRFEDKSINGVAHFLEHMMFKATRKRTAREIVRRIESLGGNLNAFTAKEQTCYHIEILDEHLSKAIDVLADVLCREDFPEKEFEKERQVILDEIQSAEDTPDEVVLEYFATKMFPDHALGNPILGVEDTINAMTMDEMMTFYRNTYTADRTVIAVAGHLQHNKLVAQVQQKFNFPQNISNPVKLSRPKSFGAGFHQLERPVFQSHLCIGVPGIAYDDPAKWDLLIMNTILGDGMGSRLFQNIRERYGIAYAIFSFAELYHDCGVFGVYLGTDQRNIPKAQKMLVNELDKISSKPVSQRELRDAKSYTKGNIMLRLENTSSRMNRLAMLEIYNGKFQPIDHVITQIEQVSRESIMATASRLLSLERRLTVILSPNK